MALDPSCVGKRLDPVVTSYDWRDVALYALGLSATTDDLGYLLDQPAPKVLPTFGVVPAFAPVFEALRGTGANLVTLLHSGQRSELFRPFPAAGELHTTVSITGIWDMKVGAIVEATSDTAVNGEPVARTVWHLLLRGEGGFGGPRPPKLLKTKPPSGVAPAFRTEVATAPTQALLYRLNGDINPIHSHPPVAKEAGFERPILHGLCFYGIAARVALKELGGDEPARFRAFDARFSSVVYPGDSLIVEGWPLPEPGQAAVTVTVKETGEKVIANALFEYRN